MRKEGLLVGGSSGTALAGALRWLKTEQGQEVANEPGKNVVVLLPDGYVINLSQRGLSDSKVTSIRNYMSKPWFLDIALNAPPSHLSTVISDALGKKAETQQGEPEKRPVPSAAL